MPVIRDIYIWFVLRNKETKVERQFVLPSNTTKLPDGWEFTSKADGDRFNKAAKSGYVREKSS